ncbi:hypothetical protein RHMOL_Rhmol10G0284600 [Rhododendron molle]|uniref:Uncharacterized protein n=1 Tax=Rhododendron molle TaxID=49168 RepID=A0ACC0M889_RHOML|nr:hypothetical protein RHMOL_Rhmol10G0284600 [Rhododendron molle]
MVLSLWSTVVEASSSSSVWSAVLVLALVVGWYISSTFKFQLDPLYVFSKHPDTVDKTLTELTKYNPTLVLVILPNDHSFHGKVKRLCEVQLGLITQCCRAGRVRLATNYFFDSLAAKINVKVVASMDWPNPSKYRVELAWQTAGVEIISSMEMLIRNQLIAFQKINNYLAKRRRHNRGGHQRDCADGGESGASASSDPSERKLKYRRRRRQHRRASCYVDGEESLSRSLSF